MTRTVELNNFELYEIDGETYSLEEIRAFITTSNELAQKTERQTRFINALKMRCSDYSQRIIELESEIADMKFTRKYLTSEEAGKAFARELLGKPMTPEDIAIEQAENCYVPYSGDDF